MIASYLLASVADVRIAVPVSVVEEIIRAVALTPLPSAPAIIEGAVNMRGVLLPVINLRVRLGLPRRAILPSDFLIVLRLPTRRAVIRVDDTDDVAQIDDASIATPASLSASLATSAVLAGVAATADGALVIYDPAAFLSQSELEATEEALSTSS
ncbi:MAG: chemotaxis protein CheW [Gemmatimonadaceae bacterium]